MIYLILDVERSDYMDTNSPVYNELNKAWKATCKVLFGEEIGELKEYGEWLKEYMPVIGKRKSHISGKDVTVAFDEYCKDARFVSLDEVKEKSIEPLTINEIKDIDSIVEAISEKWEYAGNKILGMSTSVDASDDVKDSQNIIDSISIGRSSYIYASFLCVDSKYIFGSARVVPMEFAIHALRGSGKRQFEAFFDLNCSDIYVSANCADSSDILFSFNLRNKHNCIGNLQLPKDKYFELKTKLISEIKEELKKNKKFPSIFELIQNEDPKQEAIEILQKVQKRKEGDLKPIENAFRSTFKVLFKKDVEGIAPYEDWLYKNVPKVKEIITATNSKTYTLRPEFYKIYSKIPEKRVFTFEETSVLGELHLEEADIINIEKIKENLPKIAYITDEYFSGRYENLIQCGGGADIFHIYRTDGALNSEYIALSSGIIYSRHAFGCTMPTNSQFSIHVYNSSNLTRSFEVDSSTNCSDTYFAHNCEGLNEAMFCWNTKGKRYAIGNAQLPPDQYRKIKDMLVSQMADEILSKKELKYDIFNIGCGKK